MKLMPASRAFATIRVEVGSSVGPPNIMVPRQIGEIFRPLRPRLRYCMGRAPGSLGRHCEPTGRREAPPDDRLREAIQLSSRKLKKAGLLRRFAPRTDERGVTHR